MFKPMPKATPYRNPELLALAKQSPRCMSCHEINSGQVVAAHSNSIANGKGTSQKAHDLPAFVCDRCHDVIDGRDGREYTAQERELKHLRAVFQTVVWLLQNGHMVVN